MVQHFRSATHSTSVRLLMRLRVTRSVGPLPSPFSSLEPRCRCGESVGEVPEWRENRRKIKLGRKVSLASGVAAVPAMTYPPEVRPCLVWGQIPAVPTVALGTASPEGWLDRSEWLRARSRCRRPVRSPTLLKGEITGKAWCFHCFSFRLTVAEIQFWRAERATCQHTVTAC
jgi:hypothetical protein